MSQEYFDPEVYADFVVEAREHLETIEPKLLELEKNPSSLELLDDIFRPMHSLKGASGFLGLKDMNALAHKGENILDELRQGRMQATSTIMDLILEATDTLRTMVDNLESQGHEGGLEIGHILEQIERILKEGPVEETAEKRDSTTWEDQQAQPQSSSGEESYALNVASQEHLNDFIEEAREHLSDINSLLLKLENSSGEDQELLNDLFRNFHNLKGNSGIIGYTELNTLAHETETLLNQARSREIKLDSHLLDLLLNVVDVLENLLNNIHQDSGEVTPADISGLLEKLQKAHNQALGEIDGGEKNVVPEYPVQDTSSDTEQEAQPSGKETSSSGQTDLDPEDIQIFESTVYQQFSSMHQALDYLNREVADKEVLDGLYRALVTVQNSTGYMGFQELKKHAERTADLVDQGRKTDTDPSLMAGILKQEVDILESMVDKHMAALKGGDTQSEGSGEPEAVAQDKAPEQEVGAEKSREIQSEETGPEEPEPAYSPGSREPEPAESTSDAPRKAGPVADNTQKADPDKSQAAIASTIRVEHSRLDELMNLIGELIINRNRFSMLSRSLEEGHDVMEIAQQLNETTNSMARISDDLQATIMNVRMIPVRTVFSKFSRLVRDLSRKNNKKVQLITEGEETELDKSVAELIGDPLVHLIRNAVDHGLENEEERLQAGKEGTGSVWLRAMHKGNSVVIELEDDGRGIDPEKIKAKAVDKGVISEEEARTLEEDKAVELIFAPGFSTSENITDVSGRGVGMDVVKNNIKSLKGNISVSSAVGQGSKFTVSLPLTLAIIDALIVKVAGKTYAIPLDAVSETTKIDSSQITQVNGRKAITLRDEVLGISDLAEVLSLPENQEKRQVLPLVIVVSGERRLGLAVDSLMERQEIVIKSLGEYLGDQQGVSGATIMGDGSVVLILDPAEIYNMATSRN